MIWFQFGHWESVESLLAAPDINHGSHRWLSTRGGAMTETIDLAV